MNCFVKVVTMLLGEFEFADLVEGGEATWFVKVVFLLFIMMMSIFLINLVIGLSINDINEIRLVMNLTYSNIIMSIPRKEAHVHKLINTVSAIKSVERLVRTVNNLFPCFWYNTRLTCQKTCTFEDQVNVTCYTSHNVLRSAGLFGFIQHRLCNQKQETRQ